MRIFLTGASGYVGLALCRRLASEGHELRALVRATSRVRPLEELGVSCFTGDLGDRYSMREAMSGADWVVHAAAELDVAAREEQMRWANVEGSDNVASLAFKLGTGRFLAISSIAAYGGSPADGSAAGEESALQLPFPNAYCATKHAGEQAIRAWAERGLKLNTVYPSLVYGPPGKKQGFNAFMRTVLKGRMPALVGAGRRLNLVHLEDLVEGIVRVMERAEPGARYLLAGEATTVGELARQVCELGGVAVPRLRLPPGLAGALLALVRPYYRMRGFRPPISGGHLATLKRHWHFDDARARRELGWRPRSLAEGLPPTVEYLLRT